jgi:uncharacterized protein (DUF58 family)
MPFVANKEIIEQVRRIKILSRRLAQSHLAGDYASAFKGTGFEFDQLREYQFGDDVRFINWNASAKSDSIMIKEFIPERDRCIILAVDCSSSLAYSSKLEFKKNAALTIAATIAFIASLSNDKVGLLAFSDKIHAWQPPQKGKLVLTKILDTLCLAMNQGGKTNLPEALKFLSSSKLSKSILFFISDWITEDGNFNRELKLMARKHEAIVVRVLDELEHALPNLGVLELVDPETGARLTIDSGKTQLSELLKLRLYTQNRIFENSGLELIDVRIGDKIERKLATFFHNRTTLFIKLI